MSCGQSGEQSFRVSARFGLPVDRGSVGTSISDALLMIGSMLPAIYWEQHKALAAAEGTSTAAAAAAAMVVTSRV
jgi:hypothetical protein